MRKILQSQRGETLIEVVLSVALFSVTMTMIASMYFTAMRVTTRNHDTEQKIDGLVSAAVEQTNQSQAASRTVIFTLSDARSVNKSVKLMKTQLTAGGGTLYQFSE